MYAAFLAMLFTSSHGNTSLQSVTVTLRITCSSHVSCDERGRALSRLNCRLQRERGFPRELRQGHALCYQNWWNVQRLSVGCFILGTHSEIWVLLKMKNRRQVTQTPGERCCRKASELTPMRLAPVAWGDSASAVSNPRVTLHLAVHRRRNRSEQAAIPVCASDTMFLVLLVSWVSWCRKLLIDRVQYWLDQHSPPVSSDLHSSRV